MPLLSGALPISEVFDRLLKGLRAMGRVIPRITVQEFCDQRDRMVPAQFRIDPGNAAVVRSTTGNHRRFH